MFAGRTRWIRDSGIPRRCMYKSSAASVGARIAYWLVSSADGPDVIDEFASRVKYSDAMRVQLTNL